MSSRLSHDVGQNSDYLEFDVNEESVEEIEDFRTNPTENQDLKLSSNAENEWKLKYRSLLIDYEKLYEEKKNLQSQAVTMSAEYNEMKREAANKESLITHIGTMITDCLKSGSESLSRVRGQPRRRFLNHYTLPVDRSAFSADDSS